MTDEELWLKHIEEYPQIKTWSEEKREGARKGFKSGLAEGRKEKCNSCGLRQQKRINLAKENEQLKEQIEEMKSFVKSMYEANKNDAYCREYLGTILNEWS